MKLGIRNSKYRHRRLYVLAVTIPLLAVLLPAVYLGMRFAGRAEAAWFNDSFLYRTALSFTHNAAESTGVIKYDIDTATLITAGKMQSDCGDSRFTDITGRVLPYYIDSAGGACNGASTDYYVDLRTVGTGVTAIYHYYGNPTATNGTESLPFTTATVTPSGGSPSAGSEEKTEGPVIQYHMDEAVDNTCSGGTNDVCDSRGTAIDGAISNGTAWKDESYCISGACLLFDGSNDVVTTTQTSSINFSNQLASGFTISAWIRPTGAGEGSGGQIFYKGTNSWLRVDTLSSGRLDLQASLDLATTDATLNVSSQVVLGHWTHVTLSYTDDADDEITIWVNGQAVGTSSDGSGAPASDTNDLLIGGTTTDNFAGFMDDFKIYAYEKTTAQMKVEAVSSPSSYGASSIFGDPNIKDYTSSGLVGSWKMDESSGSMADSSGFGTSLTDTNTVAFVNAKFLNGGDFESGSSEYQYAADNATLSLTGDVTVSAWIRPESVTAATQFNIAGKWDGSNESYLLAQYGDEIRFYVDSASNYATTNAANLTTSTWAHIIATYSASTQTVTIFVNGLESASTVTGTIPSSIGDDAGRFHIGAEDSSTSATGFYDGVMDDVRVFSRALSKGQAQKLADWAEVPTGYWNLDEKSGGTAYDRSANGANGSTTGSTWMRAKRDNGLFMTAASQSISLGNIAGTTMTSHSMTAEAWVSPRDITTSNNAQAFVTKRNGGSSTSAGWEFYQNGNGGAIGFYLADGTDTYTAETTSAYSMFEWFHLAAVYDVSVPSVTIYINGEAAATTTSGTLANIGSITNSVPSCIGASSNGASCTSGSSAFNGIIDDVRVYKYARSQRQVVQDMQMGRPIASIGTTAGFWRLDSIQDRRSTDYGPNGYEQTLELVGTPTIVDGKSEKALSFNGSSMYATTQDTPYLSMTGSLSLTAWIKPSVVTAATRFPIAGKVNSSTLSYLLEQYGDEIRVYIGSTSNYVTTDSANLATDTWYHVSALYNATAQTVTILINGKVSASTVTGTIPASISDSTNGFVIGADNGGATYQISTDADDGIEVLGTTWSATPANSGNAFGFYTSVYNNVHAGVRFQSITAAQAATVNVASLYVYATLDGVADSKVNGRVYADDVDDAPAWSGSSRPSSGFTNTTASSDWEALSWSQHWMVSPRITSVVQELLDRGGWASGNDMRFSIKNNGTTGINLVTFRDYTNEYPRYSPKFYLNLSTAGTNYYNGAIDEVKVYNGLLNAEQIYIDRNGSGTASISVGTQEDDTLTDGSGNNPSLWYKFDENTGIVSTYDSSGNEYTGTLTQSLYGGGKYGSGILLNGSGSYVDASSSVSNIEGQNAGSISVWFKSTRTDNTAEVLFSISQASSSQNTMYLAIGNVTGTYADESACFTIIRTNVTRLVMCNRNGETAYHDGNWHHISISTGDGTNTMFVDGVEQTLSFATGAVTTNEFSNIDSQDTMRVGNVRLSSANASHFSGVIDELKVYTYARTNAQLMYDYNRGGPINWYKFDECQGSTAYDASGRAKNGTITIGAGSTQTSLGSCAVSSSSSSWSNGASGKYSSALNLEGGGSGDDYMSVSSPGLPTGDFTYSAWVYPNSVGDETVINIPNSSGGNEIFIWILSGQLQAAVDGASAFGGSTVMTTGQWYHVALTRAGSTITLYLDGKSEATSTDSDALDFSTCPIYIGVDYDTNCTTGPSNYFAGKIDDVRVYNYGLSATQIKRLMNEDGAVRFGPSSGSP